MQQFKVGDVLLVKNMYGIYLPWHGLNSVVTVSEVDLSGKIIEFAENPSPGYYAYSNTCYTLLNSSQEYEEALI